jgi:hypothetical protein
LSLVHLLSKHYQSWSQLHQVGNNFISFSIFLISQPICIPLRFKIHNLLQNPSTHYLLFQHDHHIVTFLKCLKHYGFRVPQNWKLPCTFSQSPQHLPKILRFKNITYECSSKVIKYDSEIFVKWTTGYSLQYSVHSDGKK